MKKITLFIIIASLSLGSVCFMSLPSAEASDYLGDYCWTVNNFTVGQTFLFKLGISNMGGGHFQLSGVFIVNGKQIITNGNAELINANQIAFQLYYSGVGQDVVNGMFNLTLDSASLNGTFGSSEMHIAMSVGSSGGTPKVYANSGTVTLIQCP